MGWRLMRRYEAMKKSKDSRKIDNRNCPKGRMLREGKEFGADLMVDHKIMKKAESMSKTESLTSDALAEGTDRQKKKAKKKEVSFKNEKIQGKVNSPVLPEKS
jgi:hypothetical protein